jgi:hypothetical protein
MYMNKTTTVSALFLAGAMLLSSCPTVVHAKDEGLSRGATLVIAGIAPVVAGWIMLYSRKSEKEFKTRYSPATTKNFKKIGTREYWINILRYVQDEIIGQRKQSSALKAKSDGKIYPSEETPAYGVLGTIDAYAAPFAESATKFTAPFLGAHVLWGYLKTFANKATGQEEPKKVDPMVTLANELRAYTNELRAQRQQAAQQPADNAPEPQAAPAVNG